MSPPGDMTISFCETEETSSSNWTECLSEKAITRQSVARQKRPSIDAEASSFLPTYLDGFGKPLVPTHTEDPLDPLNWSKKQKSCILAIVCLAYFISTYLTTITISSSALLQAQFSASRIQLHWISTIPSLGLATSPLLVLGFANRYGRRVVMILGTTIALVASGCTSIPNVNFSGYLAARFFQGFGMGPATNVGLTIVNDLSWEQGRGLRVGLWALSGNVGLLIGLLVGSLLVTVDHQWLSYHMMIIFSVLLILEGFFLPETLYPRSLMVSAERNTLSRSASGRSSTDPIENIKRTKQLPFLNLTKIPGIQHQRPWVAAVRTFRTWTSPALGVSVASFVFFQYWWVYAILRVETIAYENLEVKLQGVLVLGLILGVIFAEFLCSGRLSDAIVRRLARVYGGDRHPEMRLWLGYPAAVFSSIGLVVWGLSIDEKWHWMIGECGFFLYAAGLQMGTTTITTYLVDSYQKHATEAIALYGFVVNISAFVNPWFINEWLAKSGFTWTFVTQAIVCTVGALPTCFILQKFGCALRGETEFSFEE